MKPHAPGPRVVAPLLLAALSFLAARARAGGVEVQEQGARAAGQADAFMAQADDPSAIYYNPAGLAQLHGSYLSAGAFLLVPDFHFKSNAGAEANMTLPSVLPHLYASSDFGLQKWRFGVGAANVFGINEDWGGNGPLRTSTTRNHLFVENLQPTIACQIDPRLSVGAGLNVYYGDINLENYAAPAPAPIHFKYHGDGVAFGATVGVQWKINDRHTLAGIYRSPFSLDFSGDARLNHFPGGGPTNSRARIDFPPVAGVGYAYRPTPPLKIEADVIYTGWETLDQVRLRSASPLFNGITIPSRWTDGLSYRLGVQYDLTPHWSVRTGYAFGQNAVPQSTFAPLVPDSNYHLLAAGVGYSTPKWSVDAAYQFIYRERRHINHDAVGPAVEGTWDNQIQGVLVTATLKL